MWAGQDTDFSISGQKTLKEIGHTLFKSWNLKLSFYQDFQIFRALIHFLRIIAKMFFPVREKSIAGQVAIVTGAGQGMDFSISGWKNITRRRVLQEFLINSDRILFKIPDWRNQIALEFFRNATLLWNPLPLFSDKYQKSWNITN